MSEDVKLNEIATMGHLLRNLAADDGISMVGRLPAMVNISKERIEAFAAQAEAVQRLADKPDDDLAAEVASVLVQLDEIAEQWGDEAQFRRCRDRLRAAIEAKS